MKKLIICDYIYKRYLLKYKASHDFPYKIMTKNELYDSLCFSYSEEALKILLETKQYDYSALKKLTDILKTGDLSIKDKDTNNIKEKKKKLNIYLELLKKNKAIIYDDLINEELKNTEIYLFESQEDQQLKNVLTANGYSYEELSFADLDSHQYDGPKNYLFGNKLDQFNFIFSDIRKKIIKDKIPPHDLAILIKDENDFYYLDLMSDLYDIKIEKTKTMPLISKPQVKQYLLTTYQKKKFEIDDKEVDASLKTVYDIITKYEFEKYQDFDFAFISLQEILGTLSEQTKENNDGVRVLTKILFDPSVTFYVTNYTSDDFYKIYDDNNIFIDAELKELGVNTSYTLTKLDRRLKLNFLLYNKIEFVSRVKLHLKDKIYDSAFTSEFKDKWPKPIAMTYNENGLYTTKSSELLNTIYYDSINATPQKKYRSYNNTFTGINSYNPKNTCSISSLDTYADCPFKYLLDKVLKLNNYDAEFDDLNMRFGTFIHEIFEDIYSIDYNFENIFSKAYEKFVESAKSDSQLNKQKEEIWVNTVKHYLKYYVDAIRSQLSHARIIKTKNEEPLSLKKKKKKNIISYVLNARIDKIIFTQGEHNTYYTIIDYKTGSTTFDYKKVFLGSSLQLPLYSLALQNSENIGITEGARFAGFGIQHPYYKKILYQKENPITNETYLNSISINGLSYIGEDYLKSFDDTYQLTKSGDIKKATYLKFSLKFLDDDSNLNKRIDYTYNKLFTDVKEAATNMLDNIYSGDFSIRPAKHGTNDACKSCNFRDICYRNSNDYRDLGPEIRKHFNNTDEEEDEDALQ